MCSLVRNKIVLYERIVTEQISLPSDSDRRHKTKATK